MLVIDEWVVLLVPVTLPAFLDIIVFLHGFALAFIISQTYVANNYNTYQCCIQKKFVKIDFSWGFWGAKSRALVVIQQI